MTRWITKKGSDGENRHIPIQEGQRRREKEIITDEKRERAKRWAIVLLDDELRNVNRYGGFYNFFKQNGFCNYYYNEDLCKYITKEEGDYLDKHFKLTESDYDEFATRELMRYDTLPSTGPGPYIREEWEFFDYQGLPQAFFQDKIIDILIKGYKSGDLPKNSKLYEIFVLKKRGG
jgi:hypothetical protein